MPMFPTWGVPYFNPYNRNYYYYNNIKPKEQKSCQIEKNNLATNSDDKPLFEIFGLQLYMDDILILCLLYFLYEENVKDELLFIALLLLLLS